MYVAKVLRDIQKKHPGMEVEVMDVATNFGRMRKAGILGFPAVKIGDEVKSWFIPSRKEIVEFVESEISK